MMELRRLGKSGIKVSPLGLGTARMAGIGWHDELAPKDPSQAMQDGVRQIQSAIELGVGILFRSNGAVILVIFGAAALITYIKTVEEKEMEARFGAEYTEYKRRTPFIIPGLRKRG